MDPYDTKVQFNESLDQAAKQLDVLQVLQTLATPPAGSIPTAAQTLANERIKELVEKLQGDVAKLELANTNLQNANPIKPFLEAPPEGLNPERLDIREIEALNHKNLSILHRLRSYYNYCRSKNASHEHCILFLPSVLHSRETVWFERFQKQGLTLQQMTDKLLGLFSPNIEDKAFHEKELAKISRTHGEPLTKAFCEGLGHIEELSRFLDPTMQVGFVFQRMLIFLKPLIHNKLFCILENKLNADIAFKKAIDWPEVLHFLISKENLEGLHPPRSQQVLLNPAVTPVRKGSRRDRSRSRSEVRLRSVERNRRRQAKARDDSVDRRRHSSESDSSSAQPMSASSNPPIGAITTPPPSPQPVRRSLTPFPGNQEHYQQLRGRRSRSRGRQTSQERSRSFERTQSADRYQSPQRYYPYRRYQSASPQRYRNPSNGYRNRSPSPYQFKGKATYNVKNDRQPINRIESADIYQHFVDSSIANRLKCTQCNNLLRYCRCP